MRSLSRSSVITPSHHFDPNQDRPLIAFYRTYNLTRRTFYIRSHWTVLIKAVNFSRLHSIDACPNQVEEKEWKEEAEDDHDDDDDDSQHDLELEFDRDLNIFILVQKKRCPAEWSYEHEINSFSSDPVGVFNKKPVKIIEISNLHFSTTTFKVRFRLFARFERFVRIRDRIWLKSTWERVG